MSEVALCWSGGLPGKDTGELGSVLACCSLSSLCNPNFGSKRDDTCHYLGSSVLHSVMPKEDEAKHESLVEFRIQECIFGFIKTSILESVLWHNRLSHCL